jgi:hypothetical protein
MEILVVLGYIFCFTGGASVSLGVIRFFEDEPGRGAYVIIMGLVQVFCGLYLTGAFS